MNTEKAPTRKRLEDERIAQLLNERRFCYFVDELDHLKGQGFRVSVVIENEPGRFPTGGGETAPWYWGGDSIAEARAIAEAENTHLGLTMKDVITIINSSMFPKGKRAVKRSRRSTKR